MSTIPEVREIEQLAEKAKVDMAAALSKAGVAESTYWRWRHDKVDPSTKTLRKIRAAIFELGAAAA